jgi:cytoskeleton protein RodZ
MSEPQEAPAPAPASKPTAGRLLREAREKQGLHIAALAAAIKVSPKKLELLESDRFDELPDTTFTRALAQTVCRALKVDAAPVMQLLPPPSGHRLEHVGEGLNTPFRERPGALVQRDWMQIATSPVFWIVGLILVATATVYLLPASVSSLATARSRPASAPLAHAAIEPGMPPDGPETAAATSVPVVEPRASAVERMAGLADIASAPRAASLADVAEPAASAAANPLPLPASMPDALPAGMLQLRSSSASWVEVTDGRGKPLLSRLLRPGEAVGVDGTPPLKVRIGNAAATQVTFRGQPTELQAFTRDNVARLELR